MSEDSDEQPSRSELAERVDQLESTVQKMMPGRREMLRMGAASGAGLLAGGAGVWKNTERVRAQASGTVGGPDDRQNWFVEQLDVAGGANFRGSDLMNVGAAEVEVLNIGSSDLVATGDYFPLHAIPNWSDRIFSTSSTSYADGSEQMFIRFVGSDLYSSNLDLSWYLGGRADPQENSSIDVRIQDVIGGTTLAEKTGISSDTRGTLIDWTQQDLPSSDHGIKVQIKTSDGSSASLQEVMVVAGVSV